MGSGAAFGLAECVRARDHFKNLLSDCGLAGAVHCECEVVDELASIVAGIAHGGAPGGVLGFNFGMGMALNDKAAFSLGYDHNLSKRTALYTSVSKIENKGKGTFGVLNTPKVGAGGGSGGFDVGVRHSF